MPTTPSLRPSRPLLAGAASAVLALGVPAARAEAPATELATVVVTASPVERTLKEAPASVSVITREDIESRPVTELAELLGSVEGVTLSRSGNLVPGVQIRGMGQAYTLILVDGKRVNSTNVMFRGNDYDTGWVPASEIERIEVVRGPMSSLYGSDAIGGVVNIITRQVGKTWRGSAKIDAVLPRASEAGDGRSASVSVSGPVVADTLGLRISAGYDRRDADGAVNDSGQDGFQRIENRLMGAQLVWTPNKGHEVKLGLDASKRDHDGFLLEREALSVSHQGRYGFGMSELTLNLDETRNLIGAITGQVNPNQANSNSLNGKFILPLDSSGQVLTVGAEYRDDKLDDPTNLAGWPGATNRGENTVAQVSQYAVFIEDEISLGEKLKVTLGNRYDHHENFGGHHSPRAYAVYQLTPALTLKTGVAKAFRAPTLLQGSTNWGSVSCGSATVGCYIVGNPDLKPETSTSQEIGLHLDQGAFGAGVTLFRSELKDMIDIANRTANAVLGATYPNYVGQLADGRPVFAYENIARVRTQGLEASFRADINPQWAVRGSYTYTHARNTSTATSTALAYRPQHQASVTVDWKPAERWSLQGSLRHVGEQVTTVWNHTTKPAYQILDLSAAYRINDTFTVRGGLLNVADEGVQRQDSADYNEEGRRVFVSLSMRF